MAKLPSQTDITLSEQILKALTEQIIRGELAPNAKLRQDHIAKTFSASHVPVREALLRLESHGLAISIPRRGVRVAPFEPKDIVEVKAMRLALEPMALHQSIPKLTAADLKLAKQAQSRCNSAPDLILWEQANRRFHNIIVSACGMPRLLSTLTDLQILSGRHLIKTWQSKWVARTDSDHSAIMSAISRKDSDTAMRVLRQHLKRLG